MAQQVVSECKRGNPCWAIVFTKSGYKSDYCAVEDTGGNAPEWEAYPPTDSVRELSDLALMFLVWNPNPSRMLRTYLRDRDVSYGGVMVSPLLVWLDGYGKLLGMG